jgi:hypothetical protein
MTIASGSTTRLAVIKEATWGTTPTTPVWLVARMTGESLNLTKQFITSNEIQSDRNVRDAIGVGKGAGGDIQIEWAYGGSGSALDAMLESVMWATWSSDVLKNGTSQQPLSIEKTFETGATDVFCRMTGMVGNTLSLTASARQILTGSIGFIGKGGSYDSAIVTGATYTAAPTGAVMDAAANFASLSVTGLTSPKIRTVTLNATNNLREQAVVGSDELAGIGAGRFEVSGTMEVYLEDKSLLDLYFNSTAADLSFVIGSVTTEKYRFDVPNLKFTSAEVVAGGNDADVVVNAGWQGLYDSSESCTLKITREVA